MIGFSVLLTALVVRASQPPPVVTISAAELAPAQRLTIAREPVWRIGGESDGPYSFTRIVGGTFMRDARVAVLENKPSEVRLFSDVGKHVQSFGRQGRGPGEFEEAGRLQIHANDSLVVTQNLGVSVFGSSATRRTIFSRKSGSASTATSRHSATPAHFARGSSVPRGTAHSTICADRNTNASCSKMWRRCTDRNR